MKYDFKTLTRIIYKLACEDTEACVVICKVSPSLSNKFAQVPALWRSKQNVLT